MERQISGVMAGGSQRKAKRERGDLGGDHQSASSFSNSTRRGILVYFLEVLRTPYVP